MAKPTRDILKIIFQNFFNSFKPRQISGNYMGEDYFGNKYFEIPANPSIGKRKPSRWFEPADKEAFDQEMTAEWEAWLRFRREEPPTREELVRNLQIIELKKRNAAELDKIHGTSEERKTKSEIGFESFPKYSEYESIPGQDPEKKG
ncbi:NADH dehydrogenase [ubiquinone] 1 alpha subcomplex assembly factor 2 [Eupeodes corollae]|uniref:NADH dehydrogenase [ubiquinone] 1 alpha subcomplex assembly factor 2 n=1 Tax=Eupeodes corollae TaxID=290404 RepID=UPI002490C87D|nr:NADH dehydrogenase [ubiquinone] 1 alpha subcomplex assembly factor 2 [Eupeodes corollae]